MPLTGGIKQRPYFLIVIEGTKATIHDSDYTWRCTCGANKAGLGRPLTTLLLHSAWSHFCAHLDPAAVPLHDPLAR
jgi:hypothetical protein